MAITPGGIERRVIRVTPTLDAGTAYASDDVLFDSTEIPNAVMYKGGCSKLIRLEVYNHKDVTCDFDLIFTQNQANLGTINNPVGSGALWTEALVKAAKVLGALAIDVSDSQIDLINGLIASALGTANAELGYPSQGPIFLQAAEDSTSVYFAGIDRTGSIDFGADDLEFIFHIEY
jgi:hypothetical protein